MSVDVFPMERKPLLGALIVLTFGLGTFLGFVAGLPRLMGAVFFVGYFLVVPLVGVLGESLPIVKGSGESVWRETGREFSKGRNLVDDDHLDPVDRLRNRYVEGEIDEAEFERKLVGLLETKGLEERTGDRERTLDAE